MKNKKINRKVLTILSAIFFITSIAVQAYRTRMNFKEANKNKTEYRKNELAFNSELVNQNKKQVDLDVKARSILELMNTINDAIHYMDDRLSKGNFDNIETLINDSVNGLNSIEKILCAENNNLDLKAKIDLLKVDFQELDRSVKDKNLNKSKEIIHSKLLKDYDSIKMSING
ncbi:MAG: hypothetical protein F8N39_13365 [Clostridiaceae bacterium]|nr:hypothetical protein [Clostridiaceae bacterium]